MEILVITIGILGAFALNSWNDERKDRIQEQIILRQLKEEFRANLEQLENKIEMRKNMFLRASEVLDYIDFQKDVNKDTLLYKIASITQTPSYDPIENDILRSEKIHLITNDRLRQLLATWPSEVEDLKSQEANWLNFYTNTLEPFFIDSGIIRDSNFSFYENEKNLTYLTDKSVIQKMSLRKSKNTPSVKEILNNRKFEGILSVAESSNVDINWESETTKNEIEEILALIDQEIK